eukprot:1663243-Prymnesium_polylepis.1
MQAVCGMNAASGECIAGRSVVPQLSTMPDWLYVYDDVDRDVMIPPDPWTFPPGQFNFYVAAGKYLKDPTCEAMASYAARF